ncbi:MAG: phosphotransferase family protein [Acidimicrobiales bacterium]
MTEPGTVICHGDPKPPNMVWQQHHAVGLIDWEDARPAQRISDVAYAMTWISPFFEEDAVLRRRGLPADVDVMGRAEAFLRRYGWSEPLDILAAVTARRQEAIKEVVYLGAQGIEPSATWVAEGWPKRWLEAMNAHKHNQGLDTPHRFEPHPRPVG